MWNKRENLKMKLKKIISKIGTPALLIAVIAMNANAASFSNIYLPIGGLERELVKTTKTGDSNPTVKVSTIKKGDGSSSSYTKIKCFVVYGAATEASSHTTITLNESKTLSLSSTKYKAKGSTLRLKGYGNNPLLACQVSGTFTPN